ncbi:MAG: M23 family metallopeptidase [Deltaproteobacteria bacterium]|nr:M23 family metallopeptidase [Deltaproteobacteria bacterium]
MRATNALAVVLVAAALHCGWDAGTVAAEPAYLPYYAVMDPPIVYPGAVVRLQVRPAADADTGTVLVAGRRFQGEIKEGIFSSYFAVDVDTLPGPYTLTYDVGSRHGTRTVTVRARRFDEEGRVAVPISRDDQSLEELIKGSPRLISMWNRVTLERSWSDSFLTPVPGVVGAPFGMRKRVDSSTAMPLTSVGLVSESAAAVVAANRGVVILVADAPGGKFIVIDHGLGVYTYYAGLAEVVAEQGKPIARGAAIGKLPAGARPVLHFGARLGGADVDPITLPGIQLRIPDLLPEATHRAPSEERYRAHDYDY